MALFLIESEENDMENSENINVLKDYVNFLGKGEMEKVGGLMADDIVWHQPGNSHLSGVYRGKPNLFAHLGKFMELSGNTFRMDSVGLMMANGDLVTAALHFTAERPGKKLSMDGVDLMRIEDGKIKEVWLFSDDPAAEDAFWD
jgi:uncharacterized protein